MKKYIYYISIFIIIFITFYISWLLWFFQLIIFTLLYSIISYLLYFLYKKIRKAEYLKYKIYLVQFIEKISLSFLIILTIFWSFGYYQNSINPATMSEYTISNWSKIVVFQEMSHIWAESFYIKVKENLTEYKKQWYVYFYEWVKPWNNINTNKFNKAIWIDFNKDLYKNFSKLYGVTSQDNSIYYNLINNLDFNIDVDIDYIISKYEQKLTKTKTPKIEKEIVDINEKIIETLSQLNGKQLSILVFINKAILNALIKSDSAQELISNNFWNVELLNIILDWRNEVLTKEIQNTDYKKIYITYWKLHFKGVLDLLKENNPNWKIINKKEFVSIK